MPPFDSKTDAERLRIAKSRTNRLVDHISTLFRLHEANAIVVYSPTLADQIPRSYAAHSFNEFRQSMLLFEVIRLSALWDLPGADRESIPTIISLIDKAEIIEKVVEETRSYHTHQGMPYDLTPSSDPDVIEAKRTTWEIYRRQRAEKEARRAGICLRRTILRAKTVQKSEAVDAMRRFRDRYIAHNLDLPEPDFTRATDARPFRYGDEGKLLDSTVAIADALHLTLNGTGFMWQDARDQARSSAAALWSGCRFYVEPPESSKHRTAPRT